MGFQNESVCYSSSAPKVRISFIEIWNINFQNIEMIKMNESDVTDIVIEILAPKKHNKKPVFSIDKFFIITL